MNSFEECSKNSSENFPKDLSRIRQGVPLSVSSIIHTRNHQKVSSRFHPMITTTNRPVVHQRIHPDFLRISPKMLEKKISQNSPEIL